MKIAHVICTFPPYQGGMGNAAFHYARILAKEGHQVVVYTPNYRFGLPKKIKNQQKKKMPKTIAVAEDRQFYIKRLFPFFKYGNAAFLPQLFWRLGNYDIVHLHYPFYGAMMPVYFCKLFFARKMKLIVHYHMDSIGKGLKGFIYKRARKYFLPQLLKKSKAVTCASLDYIKNSALTDLYEEHKSKFRQVAFGVDIRKFKELKPTGKRNKKEKTILFVGGLDKAHYFKGLENLLKVVRILKYDGEAIGRGLTIKLNIVGDGDLRHYYEEIARELKITRLVNFLGFVADQDLVKKYNDCDVFVLPSINQGEAFGLVLLEAMACAKPVVASNLPGVRSVFRNGKQGLLVKPNDVAGLAEKLKFILTNDELAKKMGRAGRQLVEKRYTWEKIGKELDLIYHFVRYTPD